MKLTNFHGAKILLFALSFNAILLVLLGLADGYVEIDFLLFVGLTTIFQGLFFYSPRIFSKITPIEILTSKEKISKNSASWTLVGLSLNVMFFYISSWLSAFILLAGICYYFWGHGRKYKNALNGKLNLKYLRGLLKEGEVEVALYIAGPEDAAYQVNQWLPVLEKIPLKSLIVTRNKGIFNGLYKTQLPVIYARRAGDVEKLLECMPGLQIILYPANPQQNAQMLRHLEYQHVFINHGESDKIVNQSKFLRAYDKLFLAGELSARRLADANLNIRDEQISFVGRPQAELALNRIAEQEKIETILYAPTWEGFVEEANYSSVNESGWKMLVSLVKLKRYRVMFKPHPYTGTRSKSVKHYLGKMLAVCKTNGVEVFDEKVNIHDCMNKSDLLITDISSVLNDYLVTNKPLVLCNTKMFSEQDIHCQFPSSESAYLKHNDSAIEVLLKTIEESDPLKNKRIKIRELSMGLVEDSAYDKFVYELEKLMVDRSQSGRDNYM